MRLATEKTLPTGKFKTLESLNRYKHLCLWLPISLIRKSVPWGYKIDPTNPKVALPEEKALAAYKQAKKYLKEHSYNVVSEWLGSCGYPLSDDGIIRLLNERPLWDEVDLPIEERMKL